MTKDGLLIRLLCWGTGGILFFCLAIMGESYTIKRTDTLWDLAHKFLGDPYRWPDIWNANQYIKDPHWIYPGDALEIPGGGGSVHDTRGYGTGELTAKEKITKYFKTKDSQDTSQLSEEDAGGYLGEIKGLVEKGYLGPDMLRQISYLWDKKDEKNRVAPGNASIKGDKENTIYHQYDRAPCVIFGNHTYAVGDTVDIIRQERFVKYNDQKYNLVRRIGLGRVEEVTRGSKSAMEITLVKTWDVVRGEDRIAPIQHFTYHEIETVVDAQNSIIGDVFERVEKTEAPYLYQTFIIDKGSRDGVQMGDIFLVSNIDKKKEKKAEALLGCALHVSEQTSTCIILRMYTNQLAAGDEVKLIKRIQFSRSM